MSKTLINLEVKLPDRPGSLVELINPLSDNGANIYGILHHHDKIINNYIPVTISFELSDDVRDIKLKNIQEELSKKKIQVESLSYNLDSQYMTIILSGHVFNTDIFDTIKRLAADDITVIELHAKFTEITEISNVKLKILFPKSMRKELILQKIQDICKEKDLFLISS